MVNPIVQVNVSQIVAPTPNTLQKQGALISQGATTLSSGTSELLTQLSDLTSILKAPLALTSIAFATGTATATTTAPHGYTNAEVVTLTISGAVPDGYNGTYPCTITGTDTFTYSITNPGMTPASTPGFYITGDVIELTAMATTFFAQGSSQAVSVLELGEGDADDGVAALDTYITANPGEFYSYLVPREWDAVSSYLAFLADFESDTSKTYFFTTTTLNNYASYTALMKCVIWLVEAPSIPTTEFSLASAFYVTLNYNPSSTNMVTPLAYSYLFGVTPWPQKGNNSTLNAILTANGNYVGTGAEGGISNAILFGGQTADGNDFTYWYSIDWVQINIDQSVTNAVINGSNNPSNPLYYNQSGINSLQAVAASTMGSGVSYGLVLGQVVQTELDQDDFNAALAAGTYDNQTTVNAIPFVSYNQENPGDFKIGKYAGFTIVYTPNRGFRNIVFNVIVSQFIAQ